MGECGVETIEGAPGTRRALGLERARRSKGACIQPRVEDGDLGTDRGDAIAVGARDAFDEAVQAEPAEIVRHRAGRILLRVASLELREVIAEVPMTKAGRRQREETERVHERVDPAVAEPEARGALIVDEDGGRDGVQAVFADQAVVAQRFDV